MILMIVLWCVPNAITHVRANTPSMSNYKFNPNANTNCSTTTQRFSGARAMEYSGDASKLRAGFLQVLRNRRTPEGIFAISTRTNYLVSFCVSAFGICF